MYIRVQEGTHEKYKQCAIELEKWRLLGRELIDESRDSPVISGKIKIQVSLLEESYNLLNGKYDESV
jgi:hypothetical protein